MLGSLFFSQVDSGHSPLKFLLRVHIIYTQGSGVFTVNFVIKKTDYIFAPEGNSFVINSSFLTRFGSVTFIFS